MLRWDLIYNSWTSAFVGLPLGLALGLSSSLAECHKVDRWCQAWTAFPWIKSICILDLNVFAVFFSKFTFPPFYMPSERKKNCIIFPSWLKQYRVLLIVSCSNWKYFFCRNNQGSLLKILGEWPPEQIRKFRGYGGDSHDFLIFRQLFFSSFEHQNFEE